MIKLIKCILCDEKLGTWNKEIFTELDSIEIEEIVVCSAGHPATLVDVGENET